MCPSVASYRSCLRSKAHLLTILSWLLWFKKSGSMKLRFSRLISHHWAKGWMFEQNYQYMVMGESKQTENILMCLVFFQLHWRTLSFFLCYCLLYQDSRNELHKIHMKFISAVEVSAIVERVDLSHILIFRDISHETDLKR